jgi:hypothetical protein
MWGMLLLITAACTKVENALPESNDPVFRIDGTFGSDELQMVAGDDGMYMHTFTDVKNGVNVFSGELSDGNLSVKIGLYDGNVDQDKPIQLSIVQQSENWAYHSGQDLVIFSKGMFPNHSSVDEISWTVNGVFAGINTVKINEPGVYDVCAMVTFNDGTVSALCNEIIVGFSRNGNFRMRHYASQTGELNVWLDDVQGDIDEVQWKLDGEVVSTNQEFSGYVTSEQHLVTVEVCFVNGAKRVKSMIVDGMVSGHFIDDFTGFEQSIQNVVQRDFNWVVNVKNNNEEYSSLYPDNTNSLIEIEDISYYGLNDAGNKVYKIEATVNGKLRKVGSNMDKIISINTVFGLEIVV